MAEFSEKRLAELLRALPPPPEHWLEAARQAPRIARELDQVLRQIDSQEIDRAWQTAELERAIEAAGLTAEPELVDALRRRIDSAEI